MPRGGKRTGAGRKTKDETPRQSLTLTLSEEVVMHLRSQAAQLGCSLSDGANAILLAHFRTPVAVSAIEKPVLNQTSSGAAGGDLALYDQLLESVSEIDRQLAAEVAAETVPFSPPDDETIYKAAIQRASERLYAQLWPTDGSRPGNTRIARQWNQVKLPYLYTLKHEYPVFHKLLTKGLLKVTIAHLRALAALSLVDRRPVLWQMAHEGRIQAEALGEVGQRFTRTWEAVILDRHNANNTAY